MPELGYRWIHNPRREGDFRVKEKSNPLPHAGSSRFPGDDARQPPRDALALARRHALQHPRSEIASHTLRLQDLPAGQFDKIPALERPTRRPLKHAGVYGIFVGQATGDKGGRYRCRGNADDAIACNRTRSVAALLITST
jgi:hypothetical protein